MQIKYMKIQEEQKKIFVIGFNKTGTKSLHNIFKSSKIKCIHTTQCVMQIIDKHDAFADGNHLNFNEYYEKYPDSLFILNTRPIKNWLISRYKHAKAPWNNFRNNCWCWPVSEFKTNSWITTREKHYENIFDFFNEPDRHKQLFVVNIEKEGWENAVLKFINKPLLSNPSHQNKREDSEIPEDKMELIRTNVTQCLKSKGYDENEILYKGVQMSKYNHYAMFL